MGPLSDIKRKYGSSYIWMCRYFCYVMMVGMRLRKVVDALSNILGGVRDLYRTVYSTLCYVVVNQ